MPFERNGSFPLVLILVPFYFAGIEVPLREAGSINEGALGSSQGPVPLEYIADK